jgi:hypothetical protein
MDIENSFLSEKEQIDLLKKSMSSLEGWKNLAAAIKSAPDPEKSKAHVINLFKKMAGDKVIDLTESVRDNMKKEYPDHNSDAFDVSAFKEIKLFNLYVNSLENYLNSTVSTNV